MRPVLEALLVSALLLFAWSNYITGNIFTAVAFNLAGFAAFITAPKRLPR